MVIVTLIGAVDPGRIGAFSELSVYITLPVILLAPIAGVVVDHVSKRKIMFRVHVIQALIIAATPVFMKITGSASPIWIAVILFLAWTSLTMQRAVRWCQRLLSRRISWPRIRF